MMRLTPKEPVFKPGKIGFPEDDPLDRAASGKALSGLVERIEDPMVIALDGGWGTGKSWFLKRWVGQHRLDYPDQARTVYFDAFAHDYLDDPLVAVMGVLIAELEPDSAAEKDTWTKIKTAAWKLRKPAARIALAVGTGGATEVGGAAPDEGAKALGKLATETADNFWDKEASRRDAMEEFGAALKALTLSVGEEGTPRKLVIVVDELDRCRPDYALSLLEVIKHFFAVDHVHFVLGVNLAELENMVRVRYGTQEGAALYLQKFVTLTMELPEQTSEHSPQAGSLLVFSENARNLGIPPAIAKNALIYVRAISQTRSVSIRDTDRYVSNLATLPFTAQSYKKLYGAYQHLSIMLVTLKVFHPELFKLIGTEIEADIRSAFGVLAST
ncbi:MAG: hypothetical protein ACI9AX_002180 [Polaromonas sp.]|jgi:hypothetical protein